MGNPEAEEAGAQKYRQQLDDWAERKSQDPAPFNPKALWEVAARYGTPVKEPLKRFIKGWSEGVAKVKPQGVVSSQPLRNLIEQRERALKGSRARMVNESRLLDWRGDTGVGRMTFRWPQVRQELTDLHEGLAR